MVRNEGDETKVLRLDWRTLMPSLMPLNPMNIQSSTQDHTVGFASSLSQTSKKNCANCSSDKGAPLMRTRSRTATR
jgi:hypothetical protein